MNTIKNHQKKRGNRLTKIKCIIPWLDFFKYCDPKTKRQKTEAFIKEIESKDRFELPLKYLAKEIKLLISINRDTGFNKGFPSEVILDHYPEKSLVVEFAVPSTATDHKDGKSLELFTGGYFEIIRFVLETFLVACNIAYTGSLYIAGNLEKQVIVEIDGKRDYLETRLSGSIFQEVLGLSEIVKWSSLGDISLEEVWYWITSFKDVFSGFCTSQIGKVFNALKYTSLYGDDYSSMVVHMVWLIVSLETLYLKGLNWESSKNNEIKKRVKALLKKERRIDILSDKKLGEIYSFRSNFFHGDLSLPAPTIPITFTLHKENPKIKKFYSELNNTTIILGLIVISTLKNLILNKWEALDFKTQHQPINA